MTTGGLLICILVQRYCPLTTWYIRCIIHILKHPLVIIPPYCDKSDGARERFSKKPDDYIKSFFDSYEPAGEEKKVIVSTRNGKPLFYDRNLSEIHDELIVMYERSVSLF